MSNVGLPVHQRFSCTSAGCFYAHYSSCFFYFAGTVSGSSLVRNSKHSPFCSEKEVLLLHFFF